MAWERRGRQRFYYRSKKQNGRVVREYIGRGARATQAAAEDAARHAVRQQARLEQQTWEALDAQVASLDTLMTLLSHSALLDAGYYQHHRGEWRKRRNDGSTTTPLPTEF
jgi:hypothetical protein